MNIVLFGPPFSGKGTQGDLLAHKYHIPHISTGNIFRSAIRHKTMLGLRIKSILEKGELVDDNLAVGLIVEEIQYPRYNRGVIFDGFPRNVHQAEMLDELLGEKNAKIDFVISLEICDESLIQRIMDCAQDRRDDNEKAIEKRITLYHDESDPILEFYEQKGLVHHIDARFSERKIHSDIVKVIESKSTSRMEVPKKLKQQAHHQ